MPEPSLESVVPEKEFASLLDRIAIDFAQISCVAQTLDQVRSPWPKRLYFRLQSEADELEVALDDYGARYNKQFCVFTELTASIRGFAQAGLSLTHLAKRLKAYEVLGSLQPKEAEATQASIEGSRQFVQECLSRLLNAWWEESVEVGLELQRTDGGCELEPESVRFRLPRDVDQSEIDDEEQRIAEVASKFLQASDLLEECGLMPEADPAVREKMIHAHCDEQTARVFEATVHNLQSAYDTHIGHTRLEGGDPRLRGLRGHISAALHLLGAVTHLVHFVERHDNYQRSDMAENYLSKLISRHDVQDVVLHHLFLPARAILKAGTDLAEELLPQYTDLQSMEVELPEGLVLHARPASLLVAIATFHGTPVEMAIGEQTANTSSILEVMVLVGSNPEAREFSFRGDSKPLGDIRRLFEGGLGEQGLENLPTELDYLRGR